MTATPARMAAIVFRGGITGKEIVARSVEDAERRMRGAGQ